MSALTIVLVVLALLVMVQYSLIGAVVFRYRNLFEDNRELRIGVYAAVLFFLGCAYTHAEMALHARFLASEGTVRLWHHIIGHIPQVIGGYVALVIAHRNLDVKVASKQHAEAVERERLREAELAEIRRMEALGRMARGIIHDFNHIIAVVKGFLRFIERDLSPMSGRMERRRYDSVSESVDAIRDAISQAEALSRQLAEFSKRSVNGGGMRTCTPNDIVRDVSKMLRFPTITVELDLRLPEETTVVMDANELRQVLLNLSLNARDAMPTGGQLRIQTFPAGDFGCVRVTDTGEGMNPETRAHIFEPFFTTKAKGEGTGLGLSTVYGVVTKVDGDVRVSSDVGVGTDVIVSLPLEAPAASP